MGAVDEKFDVAISTTCGALDNIVVDSVNTAQNCIQFLKKEKLGIASFIALDKQQYLLPKMRNSINTYGIFLALKESTRSIKSKFMENLYRK